MAKDKKIKILLIEDDSFLVEMYTTKFELEGFEVVSAEDGKKGLEMVKKENPDIILLDILMPKMDGFAVLDALKKDEEVADIPVILLTNLGQKDDVKKGFEKGAVGYLIKAHFMPSEVVDKIKKILKESKK
ncbi:MAG: response regulator [Candidatus Buchananbacteria bacterium]|nr:response regulator [Candidatus Buchananbacteria bacterium]